jgi:cytidine deaminase
LENQAWPAQTELVIGLVGAVGIRLGSVFDELAKLLTAYEYECHDIHLSEQLQELDWGEPLVEAPEDERIWSHMSGGNHLRELWERDDAFGLLAINAVRLERERLGGDPDRPLDRHAYVVRSLKREEEAKLLRDVYGSRFVQLSVYAPEEARSARLEEQIEGSRVHPYDPTPVYSAERLVERDEAESVEHGQNVRGIFHEGDVFVDATGDLHEQLRRVVEILFGHPNRTPTRDEVGMFHAVAAGRRSAELGRQVGAAICTPDGSVVAVGTNEVPRSGGGVYWEGDLDDAREFTKGRDTNDERKARLAERITERILQALRDQGVPAESVDRVALTERVATSEIDNLIEFGRAVHAEMAAITDAARRGIAIANDVLYVTTFPCHHCARHIVAAGIRRVVYVAPYAKSLASDLHSDAICVDPSERDLDRREITFEPFVGVGPRRYLDFFEMPARKDRATGVTLEFDPKTAMPRLHEIEPLEMLPETQPYVHRERRALALMARIMDVRRPRFRVYEPEPPTAS